MQRYLKKGTTIVVEAARVDESTIDTIANWTQAQVVEERDALTHEMSEGLNIKTPGGKRRASNGMYVIKHEGHFFVCAPSRFESVYQPIVPKPVETVHTTVARTLLGTRSDPFEGMTRMNEGPRP